MFLLVMRGFVGLRSFWSKWFWGVCFMFFRGGGGNGNEKRNEKRDKYNQTEED